MAVFEQVSAQGLQQFRILGEFFHEDLAGTVEDGLGVGETGIGIEVAFRFCFRCQFGVVQQRQRQRLDACFAGNLRLGAPFLFVGQVEVFQTLLGFGVFDFLAQFRRQFALFLDAGEHRRAPLFQFTQIAQTLGQGTQLRVIELAGGFLAVAGNERHAGAFVEKIDGGLDLRRTHVEFEGNAMFDGCEHGRGSKRKGRNDAQGE